MKSKKKINEASNEEGIILLLNNITNSKRVNAIEYFVDVENKYINCGDKIKIIEDVNESTGSFIIKNKIIKAIIPNSVGNHFDKNSGFNDKIIGHPLSIKIFPPPKLNPSYLENGLLASLR